MKVKSAEPDKFSDWWNLWRPVKRRNDGRGDARDGYAKKLANGADPSEIIDGTRWYIRNLPKGYEYVPLAKTFLNREVWADHYEQERAYQASLAQKPSTNVVQMTPGPTGNTAFLRAFEKKQGTA